MLNKYFPQNEGILIQVVPNFANDNELVEQLVAFVHDISDNKMKELLKYRKEYFKFKKIKKNFKIIKEILFKHPNIISYEIYSDYNVTCFNFWIPKKISKIFMKKIYNIWDGSRINIYEKDYIDFDLSKTQFSTIRLGSNSILPLRTEKDCNPIPHLINHLETLELEDKVLLQFILKPIGTKWKTKGASAYKRLKNGENISNARWKESLFKSINNLFSTIFGEEDEDFDAEEILNSDRKMKYEDILSKLSKKGIQVNIRVAVESDSRERSESLMNGIVSLFKIMEGEKASHNTFIRKDLLPLQSKRKFYQSLKERRIPLITLNDQDIMVTDELAKFLQQPDNDIRSNKLDRINIRQTFINDEVKKDTGLRMGWHEHNGNKCRIYWDVDDLDTVMRPTIVISNPGEGKSKMLINKFMDWINLGYGAAVIDVADGKVIDSILYSLPNYRKDDVVLLDCNDLNFPPGLSNFAETKVRDRSTSQMLTQMWTEFYINFFGIDDHHRSKDFVRKSSIPIFSFEENTILEQYLMISSEEFREKFLEEKVKKVKRLFKYYVWWDNFERKPFKVKNEETKAILNKFDLLMDNDILKNIICQKDSKVPKFRDLMDDGKIILIKAGEGAVQYEASRIIGALMLMKFWMAALSRHDQDEEERLPFKLFCDEPQNYIASGNYVKEMLAKSRKYRLGLEFYFQDPEQIEEKDRHLLKLLVSMNPHLILGKMGSDQYRKYFKERISPLQPSEGSILPRYHWIVSMYQDKTAIDPFIMEAVELPKEPDEAQKAARKVWINELKRKYARPVEEVEEDIQKRELIGFQFDIDYEEDDDNQSVSGNAIKL